MDIFNLDGHPHVECATCSKIQGLEPTAVPPPNNLSLMVR